MRKVEITRMALGILYMQVCAEKNATDEEILAVCNGENPAGTTHGWTTVIRKLEDTVEGNTKAQLPVPCADREGRVHYLISC